MPSFRPVCTEPAPDPRASRVTIHPRGRLAGIRYAKAALTDDAGDRIWGVTVDR
jgi:hypothetical protein